jgi:uncharacterized protein YggE
VTEREITVAATGEASVPPDTAVVSMAVTGKGKLAISRRVRVTFEIA